MSDNPYGEEEIAIVNGIHFYISRFIKFSLQQNKNFNSKLFNNLAYIITIRKIPKFFLSLWFLIIPKFVILICSMLYFIKKIAISLLRPTQRLQGII